MRNSILEELWYGNINPQEQSSERSKAVKDLLKLMGVTGIGSMMP